MKTLEIQNQTVVKEIKQILIERKCTRTINNELLLAYWNIGRIIIASEQACLEKAEYGKKLLKSL